MDKLELNYLKDYNTVLLDPNEPSAQVESFFVTSSRLYARFFVPSHLGWIQLCASA